MEKQGARPFHGELVTSDASTAQTVTLYDSDKNPFVLRTDERLVIEQAMLVCGAAMTVDFFEDIDNDNNVDNGERIISGDFGANGGAQGLFCARYCKLNVSSLKVKANNAGGIRLIVHGRTGR